MLAHLSRRGSPVARGGPWGPEGRPPPPARACLEGPADPRTPVGPSSRAVPWPRAFPRSSVFAGGESLCEGKHHTRAYARSFEKSKECPMRSQHRYNYGSVVRAGPTAELRPRSAKESRRAGQTASTTTEIFLSSFSFASAMAFLSICAEFVFMVRKNFASTHDDVHLSTGQPRTRVFSSAVWMFFCRKPPALIGFFLSQHTGSDITKTQTQVSFMDPSHVRVDLKVHLL